jgi:hypothetical protein
MEWSGAIVLEIEWMLVVLQTEIRNMRNQGDEFHDEEEENK